MVRTRNISIDHSQYQLYTVAFVFHFIVVCLSPLPTLSHSLHTCQACMDGRLSLFICYSIFCMIYTGNPLPHCRPIADCDLCVAADSYCSFTATGDPLCCTIVDSSMDLESMMEQDIQ